MRINRESIPLDYQTDVVAEEFNINASTCALNGGENYELRFTIPLTANDVVSAIEDVKAIGHFTGESSDKP